MINNNLFNCLLDFEDGITCYDSDSIIKRYPGVTKTINNNFVLIKGFTTKNFVDIAHISNIDEPVTYKTWMKPLLDQMKILWTIQWDDIDNDNLPDIPLYLRIDNTKI